MRPLNTRELKQHTDIIGSMKTHSDKSGERYVVAWTYDDDEWYQEWGPLNYMRNNCMSTLKASGILVVVEVDGWLNYIRGKEYVPSPSPDGELWWQKQQAKEREARAKSAAMYKDLRDFLGDPSSGMID